MAAIIASQAMISGAFSLTQQCVQLGYSPRVTIIHTSKQEAGQIYIPEVNSALMVGCLLVVLGLQLIDGARCRIRNRGHRNVPHDDCPVVRRVANVVGLEPPPRDCRWSGRF